MVFLVIESAMKYHLWLIKITSLWKASLLAARVEPLVWFFRKVVRSITDLPYCVVSCNITNLI